MIKVDRPIIVEGKYDKITLENVVDGLIIQTNGFSIFSDKEKCRLIRRLAEPKGVIILTDSDSAGSLIRGYLKKIVGNVPIINVYVPCLKGKEKRKAQTSKEGILGVEGMSASVIKEAFLRSGIKDNSVHIKQKEITKTHLFEEGLSGREQSSLNRKKLLKYLNLPENLSPNAMLDVLNNILTYEQFKKAVSECLHLQEKS